MTAHCKLLVRCVSASAFLFGSANAESLYVDDKLVLNVYAEADQSSSRVATIETGDVVEALEHADTFIRVQLADGRQGWVFANYLKAQPPAIVRLQELGDASGAEPAKRQLSDENSRIKKQNAALQAELVALKQKLAAAAVPAPAVPASLPPEPQTEDVLESARPRTTLEPVEVVEGTLWWAWLGAVLLAAGVGFIAGYQTLGKRVRERFGGVKVY
jgi:hypothetical protein